MRMQYNTFDKKAGSKTGWKVSETSGAVIFSRTVYLIKPRYVHSAAPTLSLVDGFGKHVTGLFSSGIDKILIGDFQNRFLVLMERGDERIEIFLFEVPPVQGRAMLLAGQLNDYFQQARKQAA